MKKRNLFNRFGFTGQLGKLGNLLEDMQSDIAGKVDSNDGLIDDLRNLIDLAKVTVTFDSDGGSSVVSQTISYGETATEPTPPTKDGYTFLEWREYEFMGDYSVFDFTEHLKRNVALTAAWEEVTEDEGAGGEG